VTTPKWLRKALTERLRAIARRSDADDEARPRSRVRVASFERAQGRVWVPPEPTRRWFEKQGIEPMPMDRPRRRWGR
jgi:hypothetical protein